MDNRFTQHKALYIGWDKLDDLLQDIMDDSTLETQREDFYYFNAYSKAHDTDYTDEDMNHRISDYLDAKFDSYHADENGVWFILSKSV